LLHVDIHFQYTICIWTYIRNYGFYMVYKWCYVVFLHIDIHVRSTLHSRLSCMYILCMCVCVCVCAYWYTHVIHIYICEFDVIYDQTVIYVYCILTYTYDAYIYMHSTLYMIRPSCMYIAYWHTHMIYMYIHMIHIYIYAFDVMYDRHMLLCNTWQSAMQHIKTILYYVHVCMSVCMCMSIWNT